MFHVGGERPQNKFLLTLMLKQLIKDRVIPSLKVNKRKKKACH